MSKKIIIFDLDETLRKLNFDMTCNNVASVTLRPKINELLQKLKEVQEYGIDIGIWTTSAMESVKKYFIDWLPEEYRNMFNKIISSDNTIKPETGSKEEIIYGYNTGNKPVTMLDNYEQILFFDDNSTEEYYLKKMYKDESDLPNKQVIFVRYIYSPPKSAKLYALKKLSTENNELAKKINEYFTILLEEPGCNLMIEKIEEFKNKDFKKELICYSKSDTLEKFRNKKDNIEYEIQSEIYKNENFKKLYYKFYEEYYSKINLEDEKNIAEI